MNAKEITIKNVTSNGFRLGKAVRGKGFEVYETDTYFISGWGNLERVENILRDLEPKDFENLYIKEIWLREVDNEKNHHRFEDAITSRKHFDIQKMLKSNFKNIKEITIYKQNKELLGYLPISKYTSGVDSQKELVQYLLSLEGKTLYGGELSDYYDELDYCDDVMSFSGYRDDEYWNGDYHLIHGNINCKDTGDCEYVDGRIYGPNDFVLDMFWSFDLDECLKPYLLELDPEERLCVYTRKGKDWYIGYTYDSQEVIVHFLDDDKEELEENYTAFFVKENTELVAKFKEILKSYRDNLKSRSFVHNEFYADEAEIVNKNVVELLYGDVDDLRNEIEESILDWNPESIKDEFRRQYEHIIKEGVKVDENLTVELISTPPKKYNHLKLIKRLEKRFGYELVHTSVSGEITTTAWAIKKYGEEYHFDVSDVIADDIAEEETLKEFILKALNALEKRKLEKLSQAELYEKAAHIFVGINDSLKSGNCEFGTKEFIVKHHIDVNKIGGIRGDVLLQMENSNFTKRALNQAIMNHGGLAS